MTLAYLAALVLGPAPDQADRTKKFVRPFTSVVTATVGWSEWCPPGIAYVDFESGQFRWFQQLPRRACSQPSNMPIVEGNLDPAQLLQIQTFVRAAQRAGLIHPRCAEGQPSPMIVVSNASTPYLLSISSERHAVSAPSDLGCWTEEGQVLQRALEAIFDLPRPAGR